MAKRLKQEPGPETTQFFDKIEATLPNFLAQRKKGLRAKGETRKESKLELRKIENKSKDLQTLIVQLNSDRSKPAITDALGFMSLPNHFLQDLGQSLEHLHEAARSASNLVERGPKGPKPRNYDQDFIYEIWSEYVDIFKTEPSTERKSPFSKFVADLFKIILPDDEHASDLYHVVTSAVSNWKTRAQYPNP